MTPEELKPKILALLKSGPMWESAILKALFPEPEYPKNPTPEQLEQWRADRATYVDQAYGTADIAHRDTYSGKISAATVALTKEGRIREQNNGYNCYLFTLIR